ncbi:MAG: 30S ribosome-binding factor RbfA [Bacteroidetes bacterium]|jgi:ribosome-binding factor A|nr:30S ribosome-binding factor RbfA [Bacteroidota bacterium]
MRAERVASVIKEEVGRMFQRRFSMDEAGLMTVTDVRVTPDLRQARIFVSVFGDAKRKERSLKLLEEHKSAIRSEVGKAVRLRLTPEIVFVLDESMDHAIHLEKIFKKIHLDEASREDGANDKAIP